MHLGVEVGALDAGGELARHLERDPVAALGPVERDPRDPPVALVGERLELHDRARYPAGGRRDRPREPTRALDPRERNGLSSQGGSVGDD